MPKPTEHKTVQARILQYTQETGWTLGQRRSGGGISRLPARAVPTQAAQASLYFDDLLLAKLREFNPKYGEDGLTGRLRLLPANIFGNREFLGFIDDKKEK